MSVFITGIGGMIGSRMVDYYHEGGQLIGGSFFNPTTDISKIQGKENLVECDILETQQLESIIHRLHPTTIFHLAAQSYPTVSWIKPKEMMNVNVNGTINFFEAIKHVRSVDRSYDPTVVVACSSAEYGASLNESTYR